MNRFNTRSFIATLIIVQGLYLLSKWVCIYLGDTTFCVYEGTGDVVILSSWALAVVVGYLRRSGA